jgi:hypothetical protein
MNQVTKITGVLLAIILIAQSAAPAQALTFGEFKANISSNFQTNSEKQTESKESTDEQDDDATDDKDKEERKKDAEASVKLTVTGKAELRELKVTKQAESAQERLKKMIERITERLNKHDQRLTNWLERAKARLALIKLNPEAKNVAEIEAALVKAEASLTAAKSAKANVLVTLAPQITVEDWKAQNQEVKDFKKAVVNTQLAYNLVIRDFKQALAELKKSVE